MPLISLRKLFFAMPMVFSVIVLSECPLKTLGATAGLPSTVFVGDNHSAGQAQPTWRALPELSRGYGGAMTGVSQQTLISAGGSYFPKSLFKGGEKKWVQRISVLVPGEKKWRTGFSLPRPLAYSGAASTLRGMIVLGGCDAKRHYADVFLLTWRNGKIERSQMPPLPKACANCAAVAIDETVYVAGGSSQPNATEAMNNFWRLDTRAKSKKWEKLKPWPGPARILPVVATAGGKFYLFSGATLSAGEDGKPARRYLRDAYCYAPKQGWKKLADIPAAVVAAPSPAWFHDGQIHIFGGDDGKLASRTFELKQNHPGFPRTIRSYDVKQDRWTACGAGQSPKATVTAGTTIWQSRYVIVTGEDRPGHRIPAVWSIGPRKQKTAGDSKN